MPKTVLITGCSSGLGRSTALYFAKQGWNVVATMRKPEASTDFNNLQNVLVTKLDVQDKASILAAIQSGIEQFGCIDVLVNNAGFGLFGIFETLPEEKVHEQFEVNVFGVMDTTRAILPHFRENKRGLILNVSSGAGVFTLPMTSLYCASKFALEGFSEALTYELRPLGILVKIIEPGGVTTTDFGKRSGSEATQIDNISEYGPFLAHANRFFQGLRDGRLGTEEQVAQTIFIAATDGTDQVRYVATDDIKPLLRARRETSETEYMAFMRSLFADTTPE